MSRIIESLKRLCRVEPTLDELGQRMTAASGLPVVYARDPNCDDLRFWAQLQPLIAQRDLAELSRICEREIAVKGRFENGRSRAAMAFRALLGPMEEAEADPEACEEELAHYETWWGQDRRDPAAAGVYGLALASTGLAYRGADWAGNVSPAQWALLRDYANRAAAVTVHARDERATSWAWRFANMRTTFIAFGVGEASRHEVRQAFEAAMLLDPLEVSVYEERVTQLLPRSGGSFEELDLLARQAYATTRKDLGAEMYARIYDAILKVEEPLETLVDYHFMAEGFRDWMRRAPSQPLANRFAAHAHAVGDVQTLRALFETEIREIYPHIWFGPRQPIMAWEACLKARPVSH
jgi:hypothetical protein